MDSQIYDIFFGDLDHQPMWVESVSNLDEASTRMKERAQSKPGRYFIYCCHTQKLLDSIDTSSKDGRGDAQTA